MTQSANTRQRERWATDPEYRERMKARANLWHAGRRDELAAKERARRVADPEAARAYDKTIRERRKLSPEEVLKTRARAKKWRQDNPDKFRDNGLKATFGISLDEYNAMHEAQAGCCAICRRPERMVRNDRVVRLSVDHNHSTGAVRGLLCGPCNTALGFLQDDPALMRAAVAYIERTTKCA